MNSTWASNQKGFTIVELLIVIVVIAILATISIVAYNGIQARAYDAAIKNDISALAKKMKLFNAQHGYYPDRYSSFSTMGLSVSKDAYDHYYNGNSYYNIVYCYAPSVSPSNFAIVAYGKSGNNYMYSGGGKLEEFPGGKTGSVWACQVAGVPLEVSSDRYWFYNDAAWQPYL